jgi:hypothetical protein
MLTRSKKKGGEKRKKTTQNRAEKEVIIGQCKWCIIQELNSAPCDAASALVGTKIFINYSDRKRLWPNLRCYPGIWMKIGRKMKHICQDDWCPGHNLNQDLQNIDTGMLSSQLQHLVWWHFMMDNPFFGIKIYTFSHVAEAFLKKSILIMTAR